MGPGVLVPFSAEQRKGTSGYASGRRQVPRTPSRASSLLKHRGYHCVSMQVGRWLEEGPRDKAVQRNDRGRI